MARGEDVALQPGDGEVPAAERRRRIRSLTLKLALFALAVYVVFIIAFVNRYG